MADYAELSEELTKKISKSYSKYVSGDKSIKALEMLKNPKWADANEYAWKQGEALVRAIKDNVSSDVLPDGQMYREIAAKVLPDNLTKASSKIADYAVGVQKRMDADAGYHLLALKPKQDADRVKGIVELAQSKPYEEVEEKLCQAISNYEAHTVDEAIKINAEMREKLGIKTVVTRTYDGVGLHDGKTPCQWCMDRAGTWQYSDAVANGVFERHTGCGCEIVYTTEGHTDVMRAEERYDERLGKNVRTKKWLTD